MYRQPTLICCQVMLWVFGSAFVLLAEDKSEVSDKAEAAYKILKTRCFSCHGEEKQEGGLRLDSHAKFLLGGDHGKLISQDSKNSFLFQVISGTHDSIERMPPEDAGSPLSEDEVEVISKWIAQGASWPQAAESTTHASKHWAYQPVQEPTIPSLSGTLWGANPIDAFLASHWSSMGIDPNPNADPATLLKRVSLDLIGLLPTLDEQRDFLADKRPNAYERQLDRLLASPHFGERWGRHWLDLARYADSDGYEKDNIRPFAWRYRQYVIESLNSDVPFDQFTKEQLAGDLLEGTDLTAKIAVGFHRNTLHNTEGGADPEEDRVKKTVDRTNTFGAVWLGSTVSCAQCHSHKYDPFTQREYFQLYSFFDRMKEVDVEEKQAEADFKAASVVADERPTFIHQRGDFLAPGDPVTSGTPEVFPPLQARSGQPDRLDLANWLFAESHPLTSRVAVNRHWMMLWGRGLVASPGDFGSQGDSPTYPKLLDWMAIQFRRDGWSLKKNIRLIVSSQAYQQSSGHRPDLYELDPENSLFARQNRIRLEAELIRDVSLQVSGLLDSRIGGPSVRPRQPSGYSELTYAGSAKWEVSQGGDAYRRGLYTFFQRTSPYPMLTNFDAPDSNECSLKRERSNTPLQSLTLWNDVVFHECAINLGRLSERDPDTHNQEGDKDRVIALLKTALCREPTEREVQILTESRIRAKAYYASKPELAQKVLEAFSSLEHLDTEECVEFASWVSVSRTVLNLDEFINRE